MHNELTSNLCLYGDDMIMVIMVDLCSSVFPSKISWETQMLMCRFFVDLKQKIVGKRRFSESGRTEGEDANKGVKRTTKQINSRGHILAGWLLYKTT